MRVEHIRSKLFEVPFQTQGKTEIQRGVEPQNGDLDAGPLQHPPEPPVAEQESVDFMALRVQPAAEVDHDMLRSAGSRRLDRLDDSHGLKATASPPNSLIS